MTDLIKWLPMALSVASIIISITMPCIAFYVIFSVNRKTLTVRLLHEFYTNPTYREWQQGDRGETKLRFLLDELERIALFVNEGMTSKKVVKKMMGQLILDIWRRQDTVNLIEKERRRQPSYMSQLESFVSRL